MQNNVETEKTKEFPLFRLLYKNIVIILLATVIGLLGGVGVALLRAKTTYTATIRVMFVAKYSSSNETAGNNMVLAKLYLPNTMDKIKSPVFIGDANEIYKEEFSGSGTIYGGNVSSSYTEKSLIFSLSYTDYDSEMATQKLKAVIMSAQKNLSNPNFTVAKDASLKEVENAPTIRKNSNYENYLLIGAVLGLAVSIIFILVRNLLDNTIKDRDAIEELTGIMLLATVDDMKVVDKRRKKKKKRNKR